jgi:hypothetical protein
MALGSLEELRKSVLMAEARVTDAMQSQGKDSAAYKESLKEFATAWRLLNSSQNRDALLDEILN